uniref:Anaphase-promoting complex subunit 4-like WD40 domain-containing protein n=1 Tax=Strigamia maritima TaxID=126957 RepID=T1JIV4_STRMM
MCLDLDGQGQKGVSGSPDDQLCVWNLNLEEFKCTRKQITNPGVASVRIRQDGRVLGVGGWDSRIRIFSWKSLKPLAVLDFHTKTIQCIEFSKGAVGDYGILMAAGSNDEKISLWNLYGNL